MRACILRLLAALSLCACAGGTVPDPSADGDGEGGAGSETGAGGSLSGAGGGPACDQWVLEGYGPGPDGLLGTPDDVLSGQRAIEIVDGANQIARETSFSGPGPDGVWDTPDDV